MLQLPNDIITEKNPHRQIILGDCTIVESCMYERERNDSAIIYQHELIYILKGKLRIKIGTKEITISDNEALLLKKGTYFDFVKTAAIPYEGYESILFFIQDTFILDFFKYYKLDIPGVTEQQEACYKLSDQPLVNSFMRSLLPYFDSALSINKEFIRIKTFELLFNLIEADKKLFKALAQLNSHSKNDIVAIMENNYLKNLTIDDYALLSNRSVSTFKRDFKAVFHTTPHKWIAEKRLQLAFSLLKNGVKKPAIVYSEAGFEDFSHFSKTFKKRFGILPSQVHKSMT